MNKQQQALFWLLIAPLFFIFLNSSEAAELYKVEVVVFKQSNSDKASSDLAANSPIAIPKNAKELTPEPEDSPLLPYKLLPKQELSLMAEQRALQRKKKYDVLLHVAWLQPMSNKSHSIPIHLYGGQLFNELGQVSDEVSNIYSPQTVDLFGGQAWELNGTIRVSRSRFFNVKTELMLSLPNISHEDGFEHPFNYFYLQQSQNLRANELHYFDHPLFGLLATVSPYEYEQEEEIEPVS